MPALHKNQDIARPHGTPGIAVDIAHGQCFVMDHALDLRGNPVGHLHMVMIGADLVHGLQPIVIGVVFCLFGADHRPQIDAPRHVRVKGDML